MHSSTPPPPEPSTSDGTVDGVEAFFDAVNADPDASHSTAALSDLDRPATARLRALWGTVPADVRARLTRLMVEDAEEHVERQYGRAFLVASADPDADVRLAAFDGLWENESPELLDALVRRIGDEPDARVRETMAASLGRFAYSSEDSSTLDRIRNILFILFENDPAIDVRRRALESLGYLAGADVEDAIDDAYAHPAVELRASALHAMGRQADERWIDTCLRELVADDPELRYEAVTALGSIGAPSTIDAIMDAIEDEDTEVALAAIAALGEVGGQVAINRLRQLADDENPVIAEAAEEALQEASIMANPLRPPM